MHETTYHFPRHNLYGREVGTHTITASTMLKSARGYVKKTIKMIRIMGLVGKTHSDWYRQLDIAWADYRRYSQAVRQDHVRNS